MQLYYISTKKKRKKQPINSKKEEACFPKLATESSKIELNLLTPNVMIDISS